MIKTKENERQQSHSAFFFLPSLLFKSLQHPRSIHRLTTPRLAFSNGAVDKKKIGIRLFFAKREGKFSNLSPKLNAKEIDVSAQRGRRSLLRRSIVPRNYQQPMTGWANKIWLRQIRRAPTNGRSYAFDFRESIDDERANDSKQVVSGGFESCRARWEAECLVNWWFN